MLLLSALDRLSIAVVICDILIEVLLLIGYNKIKIWWTVVIFHIATNALWLFLHRTDAALSALFPTANNKMKCNC